VSGSLARAGAALRSLDFRRLLGARLSSQFADGVFQAYLIDKIVFLSPESQGTAAGVAKAFAVLVIPFSLIGPLTGVVIDRWSRRRILAVTPLLRSLAGLALIPVSRGRTGLLLYALALVLVSLDRFYLTTAGAVMPTLVIDEDLLVGNSLAGAAGTIVTFLGLLIGTQFADLIGTGPLLVIASVLWAASGLIAVRISDPLRPLKPGGPLGVEMRRLAGDLVRGARRLAATPAALGSIASVSLDQLLIGIITVLSVVVFKNEFKQGVASYGRILGAGGAGVLVGTMTVGMLEDRLAKPRIMALAFALAGVVSLLVAPQIHSIPILVEAFTLGLTFPWRKVPADTIVQESVPDRFRGRVFALYDMAFSLPRVIAAGIAVALIPALSPGWIVAACGLAFLLWTPVPPFWIGRGRSVRLRFYAGGRADEQPRAIVIGGAEEPVEVLGSWNEERGGQPLRRLRVRTGDGERLDLVATKGASRWRVEREMQAGGPPDPPAVNHP
jgi:MFS family permease